MTVKRVDVSHQKSAVFVFRIEARGEKQGKEGEGKRGNLPAKLDKRWIGHPHFPLLCGGTHSKAGWKNYPNQTAVCALRLHAWSWTADLEKCTRRGEKKKKKKKKRERKEKSHALFNLFLCFLFRRGRPNEN